MSFFELPDTAIIGGEEVPIHTDFRNGIRLSIAARDETLKSDELTLLGLSLFFRNDFRVYQSMDDALQNLLFFFSGGKEDSPEETSIKGTAQQVAYDFESDEGLIGAAFEAAYHIDLYSCDMHWWRFLRLLEPLISGVGFSEVVQCRLVRKVPKERRAYVNQVKAAYPLSERRNKNREKPTNAEGFKAQVLEKKKRREQEILQKMREKK